MTHFLRISVFSNFLGTHDFLLDVPGGLALASGLDQMCFFERFLEVAAILLLRLLDSLDLFLDFLMFFL